jgi:hypothetical protein
MMKPPSVHELREWLRQAMNAAVRDEFGDDTDQIPAFDRDCPSQDHERLNLIAQHLARLIAPPERRDVTDPITVPPEAVPAVVEVLRALAVKLLREPSGYDDPVRLGCVRAATVLIDYSNGLRSAPDPRGETWPTS